MVSDYREVILCLNTYGFPNDAHLFPTQDLLQQMSELQGYSATDHVIVWLWELLREFTEAQRCDFLRFVWSRSRMPVSSRGFGSARFKIQRDSRSVDYLPQSHTCFFKIDLPNYPSKAILREKLLLALRCRAIDTDHRVR